MTETTSDTFGTMRSVIQAIRRQFHPLHRARRSPFGRFILRVADRPAWISVPQVAFRVRGRRLTHGLAYRFGSQERNPEALALACLLQFSIRSFWDVGANFGYYSWLLKSTAPDLRVILFEPLPENARFIRETMLRNRFSDVHLIEAGASNCSGEGALQADSVGGSTSSLNKEQTFEQRHYGVAPIVIPVKLISIDSIREKENPVEFMKIDVEGHEAASLQGATETIARDQPILFIECSHPEHQCLRVLEANGYRIVDADNLTVDCSETSSNFFCFPQQYHQSIQGLLHSIMRERSDSK